MDNQASGHVASPTTAMVRFDRVLVRPSQFARISVRQSRLQLSAAIKVNPNRGGSAAYRWQPKRHVLHVSFPALFRCEKHLPLL